MGEGQLLQHVMNAAMLSARSSRLLPTFQDQYIPPFNRLGTRDASATLRVLASTRVLENIFLVHRGCVCDSENLSGLSVFDHLHVQYIMIIHHHRVNAVAPSPPLASIGSSSDGEPGPFLPASSVLHHTPPTLPYSIADSHLYRSARLAWNSRRPINCIPIELLIHTFAHHRDTVGPLSWVLVSHVCHHWREVAISTPLLWTSVPVDKGPRVSDIWLQRSHDSPMDIVYRGRIKNVQIFADTIRPHIHRLRTLHLGTLSQPFAHAMMSMLPESTSVLEHLRLHVLPYVTTAGSTLDFSIDQFPGLRTLSLREVSLRSSLQMVYGLTEVDLSETLAGRPDSMEALLDILRRCSHLVSLTISERRSITGKTTDARLGPGTIVLPKLQRLTLLAHSFLIRTLLGSITAPAGSSLNIKCIAGNVSSPPISSIVPNDSARLPMLDNVRTLFLFIDSNIFKMQAWNAAMPSSNIQLSMEIECDPPVDMSYLFPAALCDLTQMFASSPVTGMHIYGDRRFMSERSWRESLLSLPSLESLEVGSRGEVASLFEALRNFNPQTTKSISPKLRKLSITGVDLDEGTIASIIATLEDRESKRRLDILALRGRNGSRQLDSYTAHLLSTKVRKFLYR
ncbi:uncharacterized protein LAESUDRAFT_443862 [Laetiporus sulphureus 93-53]|uniref:Uncharacterized protein n=1 Tax=Laetiporus sulphureus 93-53 TaxID=1314785 RepID=A0A165C097_9APHY|nr:uncharacterized protein LAESUDRAFT_443862 [Laetiporus sulphureus 93-53]KZT01967.1 hypothetical protein LAESUDRAFT_443862 [Laetiporus sulphureus 93-53]